MQDYEKLGVFYLGRLKNSSEPLLYHSKDLVTHAVCVGMTGSGKTGLCISLLEEAAIDGVPALVIDPKGDISNLLLQFPLLRPEDFAPWMNEEDAARQNLSTEELASQQADLWRKGLASSGEDGGRIARLQESADFAIYTPGSNAGLPLSVLKSFAAPSPSAREDRELLRDRISGAATAILALVGIEADPMKSREHILLSTIFDTAWKNGQDLSIENLIGQIQAPPLTRIGVVDLEAFFPAKERFELAMALNNLLASPGFEAWLEGEALDISRLLRTPEGKPRISILSISHLSDSERMFFVALVLNELLAWTRLQSGTNSLRALLYMDEIFGYFPPVANPPSKRPLLSLLKQARAFGVGVVLATQNPVDLDYKGLANAGTWFIGRLQTERDKQRLLEGLEGASSDAGTHFDRAAMERTLAGLGQRVFLMNNVHEDAPVLFETRWALSYLRGPMTRAQISTLMASRRTPIKADSAPSSKNVTSRVVLPPEVPQKFVPVRGKQEQPVYRAMLLGAAQVRFVDAKSNIDYLKNTVFLTPVKDDSLPVEWEECIESDIDLNEMEDEPLPGASFASLPAAAAKPKSYVAWQKDFVTWIYSNQQLRVFCHGKLQQCSNPGETEAQFRTRLEFAMREQRDAAIEKLKAKYQPKATALQDRLRRAQQAREREREQSQGQILNAVVDVGMGVFGAFFGRKKVSTAAASAVRNAARARKDYGDVGRAEETVEAVEQQIAALNTTLQAEIDSVQSQFDLNAGPLETTAIKPKKANIQVRLFALAWVAG